MGHDEEPIDYILSQVRENVKYLRSKGRVSESAARQINDLLAESANSPAPVAATQERVFSPPAGPPPTIASSPAPQQAQTQYVRALYDYNDPGDLNFRTGDVIELTPSVNDNDDWWTGRLNGKEGIFPSNHVERIPSQQQFGPSHPLPQPSAFVPPSGSWNEKPPPSNYAPPPFTGYPQPPEGQLAPTTVIVHTDGTAVGDPGKKTSKFGRLGSTMGNAAAGGVGFGAGAAIGSGIINAIF